MSSLQKLNRFRKQEEKGLVSFNVVDVEMNKIRAKGSLANGHISRTSIGVDPKE